MHARLPTVLALTVAVGCRTPDPHRDEPIVHSLRIDGAHQLSSGEIAQRLATSQTSWIPFSTPQRFDPDIWRTDLRRIERFYRERGFYQARVISEEVKPRPKNRVDLEVRVDEGEPTRVGRIEIRGIESLPADQQDAVRGDLHLREGQVFLEDAWEQAKGQITQTLQNLGYADATVAGEAKVDVETRRAEIDLSVTPGPRLHFGRLDVTQHPPARVERWRIEERAAEAVRPTDWYSQTAQAQAQKRVFELGVFGAVKVRREATDPQTQTVPLDVVTQEAPFHTLRYGLGLEVSQLRNDARIRTEYTDRDFLGGLRRLTLTGNAGWAFLPNVFSVASGAEGTQNGPVTLLTGELEQPRVFLPNLKARARLELERGIEPAYSFFGGRTKVGLVWQPHPALSVLPSYNFEAYRIGQGVASLGGTAPPLLFGCPRVCVLSYLEERVEWDRRDNRLEPHKGYYLALGIQEGGGPLGGTFEYLRFEPEARAYVSFGATERFTLAGRVHLGSLVPATGSDTDSPIIARFFSGGNEMRGFSSRRLSPMYIEPNPNTKDPYTGVAEPIGGNGLFESSIEARWNAWEGLVIAAFTDAGFVTSHRFDFSQASYVPDHLLYAVGMGARYRTPVGPIRLDFAFRPNLGRPLDVYTADPALTYYSPRGCFGLGGKNGVRAGSPEDPCTVQLSIGEAF